MDKIRSREAEMKLKFPIENRDPLLTDGVSECGDRQLRRMSALSPSVRCVV